MKPTKQSAASSRPGKLIRKSAADMRAYIKSPKFQEDAARSLANGSEPSATDLKEIPPMTDHQLGALYKPVKVPITTRIDADIVRWLKAMPGKYQTNLNNALRKVMQREKVKTTSR